MELTLDQALQKGVEAHKAGQLEEADRCYTAILKANPNHPDANHNMGILAVGVGKVEEALPFFKTAIEANPNITQFWFSYINALIKLERIAEAKTVFEQAKSKGAKSDGFDQIEQRLNTSSFDVKNKMQEVSPTQPNIFDDLKLDKALTIANKKVKDGLSEEAKKIYQDILKKFPKNKKALDRINSLASKPLTNTSDIREPPREQFQNLVNLYTKGQFQEALLQAAQLLEQFPNSINLYNIIGAANKGLGKLEKAIEAYSKALSIKPDYADAYNNMGNALQEQGKLEEAIESHKKVLSIKPDYADAYYNIGNALKEQGKLDEATEAYSKALAIQPDYAEAYNNMSNALKEQGKLEEAIQAYNKALAIKPDYAEAYNNMGVTLKEQDKLDQAMKAYKKAISLKPDYAEAYNNMGNTLKEQSKLQEAIQAYEKAISLKPDYAEAYNNMGNAFNSQGNLDEAIEAYNKALSIKPDYAEAWINGSEALEKWNKLDQLGAWLDKAFNIFDKVPADIRFMKSKLFWRNKRYDDTLSLMSDIQLEDITDTQKQHYLHLKAKCFEEAQDFDNAYNCFAQSNLLAKKSREYLRLNPEGYFKSFTDELSNLKSNELTKSKTAAKNDSKVSPVFLVGFPRSGTTLLDTILRSHSKISVIEEQPMISAAKGYLNKKGYDDFTRQLIPPKLNAAAQQVYKKECRKHLRKTTTGSVYIDKFPLNLLEASLIQQLYPDAKFILTLRHPMDSILSCWMQNFKLNSAMANMVDLDRIVDFYCIAMDIFKMCRTRYNLNVHEIRYEDLIHNLQNETEAVVKFLNLRWEPEMKNYQNTALKRGRIKTPSYSQVVQPIYKDAEYRWLNYRKYLEQYLEQVKPWISEFGYD